LKVPAFQVNLEGRAISGMAFGLYGGAATWDSAGRVTSTVVGSTATVTVNTTNRAVSRLSGTPAVITFKRAGETQSALTVNYALAGDAVNGVDFQVASGNSGNSSVN